MWGYFLEQPGSQSNPISSNCFRHPSHSTGSGILT
jgi:hypothetical protein